MFSNFTFDNFKNSLAAMALGAGMLAYGMNANAEDTCKPIVAGETGTHEEILYAGQTIEAGKVTMEVDGQNLVVTYETNAGWQIQQTHLWVGTDLADMPQTRQGNPKIGNFPYQSGNINGETRYSVSIPLAVLNFFCPDEKAYYIAAHAALQRVDAAGGVVQTETGWSDGSRYVERGMWGTYSTITLACDCATADAPVVGGRCETAFAYSHGTNAVDGDSTNSFLDIDENGDGRKDFNRWGWSNGAVGEGTHSWDIYAGAGQSDISKGTLVGKLTVEYKGDTATVWFDMEEGSPYYMEENHLYVGNEILPRDVNGDYTVAPGQYPTIHDKVGATSDSYNVENLSGKIYVVAHATVCGFSEN